METQMNAVKKPKLLMAQVVKLGGLLENDYVNSKLNDEDFAKMATDKLKFNVTVSAVHVLRRQMGIEANIKRLARERAEKTGKLTVVGRLKALEDEITDLKQRIVTLELYAKALQANRH